MGLSMAAIGVSWIFYGRCDASPWCFATVAVAAINILISVACTTSTDRVVDISVNMTGEEEDEEEDEEEGAGCSCISLILICEHSNRPYSNQGRWFVSLLDCRLESFPLLLLRRSGRSLGLWRPRPRHRITASRAREELYLPRALSAAGQVSERPLQMRR